MPLITTSFSRQIQLCLFDVLFSDVNECADVSVHQCMHNCVDTLTGYYCTCDKGFRLLSNGKTCRGMALLLFEYFTGKLALSHLSRLVRKNFSFNRIDIMNCLEPLVEISCGINYFLYCRITSSNAIVEELLVKRLNLSVGSRPSDHYFRSVCLSVCLFVQSFSQPSLIRFRSN